MNEINVGDRVKLKSNVRGTVKFIGETHVSKGIFYGIELDTPDGKSDGSLNNTYYFKCKDKHGLFTRSSQLTKIEEETEISNENYCNDEITLIHQNCEENTDVLNELQRPNIDEYKKDNVSSSVFEVLEIVKATQDSTNKENNKIIPKSSLPILNLFNSQKTSNTRNSIVPPGSIIRTYQQSHRKSLFPTKESIQNYNYNEEVIYSKSNKTDYSKITSVEIVDNMEKSIKQILPQDIQKIQNTIKTGETKISCEKCKALEIDCEEKIETFKILKKRDREKIIMLEKANKELLIHIDEITVSMEKFKKEKDDISNEFETYRQTMQSVEEDIEMITIDKEMAEENLESCRTELKELKEEVLELTEKNKQLMKNKEEEYLNMNDCPIINKYRNAVAQLTDIVNVLKAENTAKDKEIELSLEKQIYLEIEHDKIQKENDKSQRDIKELKELIDSSSNVVEIIDNLTEKNQLYESEVTKLEKRVLELDKNSDNDLQKLEDKINEVIKLRSENISLNLDIETLQVQLHSAIEKHEENNGLSVKFRDKIKSLEVEISILKSELESKVPKVVVTRNTDKRLTIFPGVQRPSTHASAPEIVHYKLKDLELKQKIQLVNILERYVIGSFDNSAADLEMVKTLLLIDQYIEKITIILNHMEDKKNGDQINRLKVRTFHKKLEFLLLCWQELLFQLKRNFYQCDITRLGSLCCNFIVFKSHEQKIDIILSWIQKDCFDESRDLKDLENSIDFFRRFFFDNFHSPLFECDYKIKHFVKIMNIGSYCLDDFMLYIEPIIKPKLYANLRYKDLSETVKKFTIEVQLKAKRMFKNLRHHPKIKLSAECITEIDKAINIMNYLVQSLSQFCDEISSDNIGLDDLISRLFVVLSLNYKYPNNDSAKNVIQLMSQISDTINKISNSLDDGLFEVVENTKENNETIIDKSINRCIENLCHLKNLPFVNEQKDKQIKQLNLDLTTQMENYKEIILSMDYVKSKMARITQQNNEQVELMKINIEKVEEEKKLKDVIIEDLQLKVSSLLKEVNVLKEPSSDILNVEQIEGNNKEGYINYIHILKSNLKFLTKKMNKLQAESSKTLLRDLKPLNIISNKNISVNNGEINKAESISRDIFEMLSTIKIPSLLENVSKSIVDERISRNILVRKIEIFKSECSFKNRSMIEH